MRCEAHHTQRKARSSLSRSAFLGSLIQNQFYLHPILPHSVELWLISSTLTI